MVAKLLENLPFEVARTHLKRREIETTVVAKLWKNLAKRSVVVAKLFGQLLAFCRLHAFVCVCVCVRERESERERERGVVVAKCWRNFCLFQGCARFEDPSNNW